MRFLIGALIAAVASVSAYSMTEKDYMSEFTKFQVAHNKTYHSTSHAANKFETFKANLDLIKSHNAKGLSWTMDVNEFADMSADEFKTFVKGYGGTKIIVEGIPRRSVNLAGAFTVPEEVDWRTKNAVTDVKNQGQCGSCWSFSTTGSVEGALALKTGNLVSFSEQQLVDCSKPEGNMGCNGGLMDDAFKYIIANGLCTEADYPYKAADGTCQSTCTPAGKISSFVDVPANNLDALQAAVALQPVSVAIEADQMGFQFYSGGVFDGQCGTNLDHGVLAAGYGKDATSGKDYWLVKNSWGATWGDQGYIKLVRTSGSGAGQCGIAMDASYPVV